MDVFKKQRGLITEVMIGATIVVFTAWLLGVYLPNKTMEVCNSGSMTIGQKEFCDGIN